MKTGRRGLQKKIILIILLTSAVPGVLGITFAYLQSMLPFETYTGKTFQQVAADSGRIVKRTVNHHVEESRLLSMSGPIEKSLTEANVRYAGMTQPQVKELIKTEEARYLSSHTLPEDRRVLADDISSHLARFLGETEDATEHLLIFVVDKQGVVLGASDRPEHYFYGDNTWFRQVEKEMRPIVSAASWNRPVTDGQPEYTFDISYPITDKSGSIIGAMHMVHPTRTFLEGYSQIRIGDTGHSMVADSEGRLLYCPLTGINQHRLTPAIMDEARRIGDGWTTTKSNVHFPDQRSVVAYSPVKLETETGILSEGTQATNWFILTSQDPKETYAYLYGLLYRVDAIGVLIVALLLVFGTILARRVVGPLQQLREGASIIGAGNLSHRLDVKTGDEIEDLAEQFNDMASSLELSSQRLLSFNAKLEDQVRGRTAELSEVNHRLEKHNVELSLLHLVSSCIGRFSDCEPMLKAVLEGVAGIMKLESAQVAITTADVNLDITWPAPRNPIGNPSDERHLESQLTIPVTSRDQVLGSLTLTAGRGKIFGDDEERLASMVAQDLGRAIESLNHAKETHRLAITDGLTGLLNHREFQNRLDAEISRTIRNGGGEFSLIFMDVDGFKTFNDTKGHLAGDKVLTTLASVLNQQMRTYDVCCRYGGDEFAVILPDLKTEEAKDVAQRLRQAFSGAFLPGGAQSMESQQLSLSIGVATYPNDGPQKEKLLDAADAALYYGKFLGGNIANTFAEALVDFKSGPKTSRSSPRGSRATAEALTRLVSTKDHYSPEESGQTMRLVSKIGRQLHLPPKEIENLKLASLLYDSGKIGIPDAILSRPGTLSAEEWEQVKTHAQVGSEIASLVTSVHQVIWAVRHHHEHFDGTGYPDGLARDQIPLLARILTVVDAFHAMIAERPYRSALTKLDAMVELRRCAGTHFDPSIVETFIAVQSEVLEETDPDSETHGGRSRASRSRLVKADGGTPDTGDSDPPQNNS